MSPEEFQTALRKLGWKASDFCSMVGLNRNSVSRWMNNGVPIPLWAERYLAMTIEVKRLHDKYVIPQKSSVSKEDG